MHSNSQDYQLEDSWKKNLEAVAGASGAIYNFATGNWENWTKKFLKHYYQYVCPKKMFFVCGSAAG